jgi:hypothetical protein
MDRKTVFFLKKTIYLVIFLLLFSGSALHARVWTDRQGRQIEAQFVRVRGENVVLQRGAKPLVIALKELCDEDQEYLKELTKGKGGPKSPETEKSDDEGGKSSSVPAAVKPKKSQTADESDPFLEDDSKSSNSSKKKDNTKTAAASAPKSAKKTATDDKNPFAEDTKSTSSTPDPFKSGEKKSLPTKSDPFKSGEKLNSAEKKSPVASDPFAEKEDKNKTTTSEANPFDSEQQKADKTDEENEEKDVAGQKTTPRIKGEKDLPKIDENGGFGEHLWTDKKGIKLAAKFVRLEGRDVVLLKDDKEVTVPMDQLCYDDKLYIRQAALDLKKYQTMLAKMGKSVDQQPQPDQVAQNGPGMVGPGMMGGPGTFGPGMTGGPPRIPSPPSFPRFPRADSPNFDSMRQEFEQQRQDMARNQQNLQNSPFPDIRPPQRHGSVIPSHNIRPPFDDVNRQMQEQQAIDPMAESRRMNEQVSTPSIPTQDRVSGGLQIRPGGSPNSRCMNCGRTVNHAVLGDTCPHCGTVWDKLVDEDGNVIDFKAFRNLAIGILVAIGIFVLACFIGGILLLRYIFGKRRRRDDYYD